MANDHILELERTETGAADSPPISPIPKRLAFLEAQVHADPAFRRTFEVVPARLAMVELDRLVVFQKQINLRYVADLRAKLGATPSDELVFRTCLPFEHPQPPVRVARTGQNAFTFVSPSNDLRFLEPALLSGRPLTGYAPRGVATGVIGLMVGYGSNYLNAIEAEGRLVLNNGSHRAYALRDLGVVAVPCVIQRVTRRDELDVVASGDLASNPDLYLKAARPPMLRDYFDPKLRKLVPVPRRLRQVTVSFGLQMTDIPAA